MNALPMNGTAHPSVYQHVLMQVLDTVLITDDAGNLTFICPNVETIFGYSAEEVQTMGTIQALLGDFSVDPVLVKARGEIANLEWQIWDKGGAAHDLLVSVKAVTVGGGTILYVCRDVTNRKQMEQALYASEERFRRIAENVPDVIFRFQVTPEFVCEYINTAVENLLGYIPTEFYRNPLLVWRILHPEDRAQLKSILNGTASPSGQLRWQHKNGSAIWLEHRFTLVYDDQGRVSAVEGTARDVTAHRESESATRRHLAEITLLNSVMRSTAHAQDLRTALGEVCTEIARFFAAPQAGVALFNAERTALEVVSEYQVEARTNGIGLMIPAQNNPSINYVLEHKAPLAIANAQTDPLLAPAREIMRLRNVNSILLVPILVGDEVVGTLGFDFWEEQHFTTSDLALVQNVANQLGQTLQRLKLFAQSQEQARLMVQLASLSETLNQSFTISEAVAAIGDAAIALTGADRAAFFMRTGETSCTIPWTQNLPTSFIEQILQNVPNLAGSQLFTTTTPFLVSDVRSLPVGSLSRKLNTQEGIRALGVWPLVYEGKTVAAVACYYNEVYEWSPPKREVMASFVRQAAIALENARLFGETQQRAEELEHLAAISASLRTASTYPEVQQVVLDVLMSGFSAAGAALVRCYPAENRAVFEAAQGQWPDLVGKEIPLSESITGEVIASGKPFVIANQLNHPHLASVGLIEGEYALACIPLFVDDLAIGVLWVARQRSFSESEIRLMVAMADIAANAIHRAQVLETLEQRVVERTWELAAANDRLTDLDRLKSKFVSDVSHELRTPLQNLKMYLELLERGRPERYPHYLATLKEQTDHLQKLTEEILDLSRLEMNKNTLAFGEIDLNLLVESVATTFQPKVEAARLALTVHLDPALPPLYGDANQLTQVITNLLTNAINYTPTGGIHVSTIRAKGEVGLVVQDSGIGVDTEDLPHLFQRFYRGGRVSESNIRGTGLGLAIVKEIVDIHNGRIEVESRERGTIFRIWLPAAV